jgi:NADPH-dependent glutamate synthase beta subunit-like oxidoreductase
MPSAVAMPELHSHLRTRALRRQRSPPDTRAGCLHKVLRSLGRAAGNYTRLDLTPRAEDRCLEIGVIGAGIAGLGAAIAMCQAGHNVEVGSKASC